MSLYGLEMFTVSFRLYVSLKCANVVAITIIIYWNGKLFFIGNIAISDRARPAALFPPPQP